MSETIPVRFPLLLIEGWTTDDLRRVAPSTIRPASHALPIVRPGGGPIGWTTQLAVVRVLDAPPELLDDLPPELAPDARVWFGTGRLDVAHRAMLPTGAALSITRGSGCRTDIDLDGVRTISGGVVRHVCLGTDPAFPRARCELDTVASL